MSEKSQVELVPFPNGTVFSVGFNENANCVAMVFIYPKTQEGLVWRFSNKDEINAIIDDLRTCADKLVAQH